MNNESKNQCGNRPWHCNSRERGGKQHRCATCCWCRHSQDSINYVNSMTKEEQAEQDELQKTVVITTTEKDPGEKECLDRGQHCWNKGTGHELNPKTHRCCFCGVAQDTSSENVQSWGERFDIIFGHELIKPRLSMDDEDIDVSEKVKQFISLEIQRAVERAREESKDELETLHRANEGLAQALESDRANLVKKVEDKIMWSDIIPDGEKRDEIGEFLDELLK